VTFTHGITLEASFILIGRMIDVIESISSAVKKLPDRREFDEVKAELS
jgi:hypothetical protein